MKSDETVVTEISSLKHEGEKSPYLTFIWGPRMGELYALDKKEVTVGRSSDCDLWVEDSAISRKHFKLQVKKGEIKIVDLGSTNGTHVNGEKVNEKVLKEGDKIQISKDTILEFNYLDETRKLSDKKRYEMGVIDPVTNTYNKRYFLDRITEEFSFAQRKKQSLSLIMFDIDHFKILNDTYGHLAGDLVLQRICAAVARIIRSDDIFARYGGEEFVVLMRDTPCQNAVNLAERIRQVIQDEKIRYEDKNIDVTVSCGVSYLTERHRDFQALISEADKFLYESKGNGRNRVTGPCPPNE